MKSFYLKRFVKATVPALPGYLMICTFLRSRNLKYEWINRLPVKPGINVIVHAGSDDLYMAHPERCSIAKKYFWTNGVREPAEDRVALNLFASLAEHADVILDIGANSGLFSLAAAKKNELARIIAFDILPEAFHILIDNLVLNNLLERVEVRLVGIGRGGGVFHAPFGRISSEMPTSLSLEYRSGGRGAVLVPIRSLDEVCLPHFSDQRLLIKIDVEGTEADIFLHGIETLKRIKPNIICEVLHSTRNVELYDQLLDDLGYRKYLITDEGLRHSVKIQADKRFKDWLITAEPEITLDMVNLLK